jgi:L-alanine-DL-glutamate epimerase-like enolase superfamily enzyme
MTGLLGSDLKIADVSAWGVDIPLKDEFTISRGSIPIAHNLFVAVGLQNGIVGYGESAPFPELTGEDRQKTAEAIDMLKLHLVGKPISEFRRISNIMAEAAPWNPAARCGLETAILDALCRSLGLPMWAFFGGGNVGPNQTDITIPIVGKERCLELAGHWYNSGFRIFKIKVGKDLDADLSNIIEMQNRFSDVCFIIDANQAFSESEALRFINSLKKAGINVRLFEQPVERIDIDAMARLRALSYYPICADESVTCRKDVADFLKASAADVINVKIMKSGVMEAFDMVLLALAGGMGVMYGGMVETRLAMGCSLALAVGIGSVHTLDLDTPLLMDSDPVEGGYRYDGPAVIVSSLPGLGATPKSTC